MSVTLGPTILIFFGLLQANSNVGVLMDKAQNYQTLEACQTKLDVLLPQVQQAFPDRPITAQCVELKLTESDAVKGQ